MNVVLIVPTYTFSGKDPQAAQVVCRKASYIQTGRQLFQGPAHLRLKTLFFGDKRKNRKGFCDYATFKK